MKIHEIKTNNLTNIVIGSVTPPYYRCVSSVVSMLDNLITEDAQA